MESNKKQPEVRFIGFCDSWASESLKNLAEINPKTILPDEFKYVDLESVVGIKLSNYRIEKKATAPSRAQRLAKKGDIFFQTVRPYQRNNYLFNLSDNDYVFSTGYAQIRPYLDSYFLFSKLQDDKFVSDVIDQCTGTSYPAINSNALSRIEIYFPNNKEEQKRIGALLENLDIRISCQQQELDTLKQTKQGFLQKMFPKEGELAPELRFPGFSQKWNQKKLGDISSVSMCKRVFKHQTTENGEIPFFKIGTFGRIPNSYISRELFEEFRNKYPYPEIGDVLISASGTIGRTVVYKGEEAYYQDSNIVWLKRNKELVENSFLQQFFQIVKWAGTEGSTIQRLYNNNILRTEISLPSMEEQVQIGNFFKQLDDLITLQQQELDALKQTKKAFLQKLFV